MNDQDQKKRMWLWLCNVPGIGCRTMEHLLKDYHTIENLFALKKEEFDKIQYLNATCKRLLYETRSIDFLSEQMERFSQKGIFFVSRTEATYPDQLRYIADSPYGLFYRGSLPKEGKRIAIVGARNCTSYGEEVARYFATELSKHQIQIVSGLARGIDSAAHHGTVNAGGVTYAVLGNGIDVCYPKENISLFTNIQQTGGIISEFPLTTEPYPYCFPLRNRIISGLSDAVLVIEAKQKSGSLITVEHALNQGKDVFAIPGRISDQQSAGCMDLIKNGACLVTCPEEILEVLHVSSLPRQNQNRPVGKEQSMILDVLGLEPVHLEEIIQRTGLLMQISVASLSQLIIELEEVGYIRDCGNHYYVKTFMGK